MVLIWEYCLFVLDIIWGFLNFFPFCLIFIGLTAISLYEFKDEANSKKTYRIFSVVYVLSLLWIYETNYFDIVNFAVFIIYLISTIFYYLVVNTDNSSLDDNYNSRGVLFIFNLHLLPLLVIGLIIVNLMNVNNSERKIKTKNVGTTFFDLFKSWYSQLFYVYIKSI